MRKTGRVLFSLRAIRAIVSPSTLSSQARAKQRYSIRQAITSAIDDIIFINEKADDTTRSHVSQETERLFLAMYMAPGQKIRFVPAPGAGATSPDADSGHGNEPDVTTVSDKTVQEFEDSFW